MGEGLSELTGVELPEPGTPVFLVLGEGVNFRSRLEAVDGDVLTITAPLETTGPAGLEPGHEFEIFWAPPRTRVVVPCRLIAVSDGAPYRWTVVPVAPARHDNRRQFVRGGAGALVRLDTPSAGQTAEGVLMDISESGLRCWIDEPLPVNPGDQVRATVWLGTGEARLDSVVHTVRTAPHGDPGQHLILTFDTPEDVARMIRQYVLAWEIGERRREGRPGT
ncbi:PilZ domain-containing protein [Actinoplanes sp. DH11]|uniref:PilZ domain-containing protein n=1 Tax=Actinoplanes sp. DH11 TaxID=2857011 RepID=UPI001E5CF4ED|nr:PilZ domain-containing protein [Actinoplanes sp. DH11]